MSRFSNLAENLDTQKLILEIPFETVKNASQARQTPSKLLFQTIQTEFSKIDNSELEIAKADVARLIQIEKMLNERIEGLEEQNSDLEERLQAMEEDLMDAKREKTVKNESWDDWGD